MLNIKSLHASWLESFDLFRAGKINLLLLITIRSLLFLYRSFFNAWFLPLTLLVGLVLNIPRLLGAFYITVLTRAARPSLNYKDSTYWQQSVFADWIIFFSVVSMVSLPRLWEGSEFPSLFLKGIWYIYDFVLRLFFLAGQAWLPGAETLGFVTVFLSPFLVIWILFMLDSQKAFLPYIKALGRAVLMVVYNYPFFLVAYGVLRIFLSFGYLVSLPIVKFIPQSALIGWLLLFALILPFWVCFITNFYIKRVHEQFSLYY